MTTQQEIHYIIKQHYSNIKPLIKAWYERHHNILGASPRELIRQGKALKVLEFLRMVKS
jgi:hypothetical protein